MILRVEFLLGVALALAVCWLAAPVPSAYVSLFRSEGALARLADIAKARPTEAKAAAPAAPRIPVGMAGCAAAACHGHPDARTLTDAPDRDCWQSSLTHWRAVDPHARAFAALQTEEAREIVRRLRYGARAEDDARCLACHTNPTLAPEKAFGLPDAARRALRAEGVGCEACHGNAGDWQYRHVAWKGPAHREPDRHGMEALHDLGGRAAACAGCHVGAGADLARGLPVRDVNHDMIAAGHPRLNFEFAEYQRRLTPHWLETDAAGHDLRDVPGFHSKAWLAGKAATAEAACRLLADRATRSKDSKAPWPEFAESNCYACHHGLAPEGWRGKAAGYYDGRRPGAAPWQTHWPLQSRAALGADWKGNVEFEPLRQALRPTRPDAAEVASAALSLAEKLRSQRDAASMMAEGEAATAVRGLLLGPALDHGERQRMTWDESAQALAAFAALERDRARGARRDGVPYDTQAADALVELRSALALPRGVVAYNGPKDYSPELASGRFGRVRELIPGD